MRKSIKISIIAVLIVLLVGGFWWYKTGKGNPFTKNTTQTIPNKNRNLTKDQEKFYADRLQKGQDYLKTINTQDINFKQEQSDTYVYLAQQYFGLGQLQKSKEMYNKAISIRPTNDQAFVGISVILNEIGDHQGERTALESALKVNEGSADTWLRYIDLRKNLGATTEELNNLYTQALEKTNHHIDVLTKDATFQEQIGNIKAATDLWKEALKLFPNNEGYKSEIKRLESVK